jgi:DNA-binding transcriptional ArsR family regulator
MRIPNEFLTTHKLYNRFLFELLEPRVSATVVSPEKGWARDRILSVLLEKPATLTEIAGRVGISKSTASYHMKGLVSKGITEIVDVENVRGGVYRKTFALRQGRTVITAPRENFPGSESQVAEQFQWLKLAWAENPRVEDLIVFLYHVFLEQGGLSRDKLSETLLSFGKRFGSEVLGASLRSRGVEKELKELLILLNHAGAATCTIDSFGSSGRVLACSSFLRTTDPASPVFSFLRGMVEGTLNSRHGGRYTVQQAKSSAQAATLTVARRRMARP